MYVVVDTQHSTIHPHIGIQMTRPERTLPYDLHVRFIAVVVVAPTTPECPHIFLRPTIPGTLPLLYEFVKMDGIPLARPSV